MARRIQDMIRDGVYEAGQRLPSQRVLSEQLGASRASVREALLSLETLGLIRTLPARGTFVSAPRADRDGAIHTFGQIALGGGTAYRLEDIFATRAMIEGELAASAARHITDTALADLERHQHDFKMLWQEGDLVGHVNADLRFHQSLAASSPNLLLTQIYHSFSDYLTKSQRLPIPVTDNARMEQSIKEHEHILQALRNRDPEATRYAMQSHIAETARIAGVPGLEAQMRIKT